MIIRLVVMLAVLLTGLAEATAGGIFDQLRNDVRANSDQDSNRRQADYDLIDNSSEATGNADPWSSLFVSLLGPPVLYAIAAPIWAPRALLGDDSESDGSFLSFPYQYGKPGSMILDTVNPAGRRIYSGTARFEYAENFDSVSTLSGHFLLQGKNRLGLDAGFDARREDLTLFSHDRLWTGTINLVSRFAQNEQVQMYFGVGANFLDDASGTDWGINFTYGGDWLLKAPWVMSLDLDLGRIGHATLSHVRWTIGMALKRYEVYVGFDHYRAGSVDLDQMVSGIRVWF